MQTINSDVEKFFDEDGGWSFLDIDSEVKIRNLWKLRAQIFLHGSRIQMRKRSPSRNSSLIPASWRFFPPKIHIRIHPANRVLQESESDSYDSDEDSEDDSDDSDDDGFSSHSCLPRMHFIISQTSLEVKKRRKRRDCPGRSWRSKRSKVAETIREML